MCGGPWKPGDKLAAVLGEQEAMVVGVKPFGLHGVTHYDVTVEFADRTVEQARLGPEAVPDGLRPGERVLATRRPTWSSRSDGPSRCAALRGLTVLPR
jgi:hypothetical protein